MKKLIEVPFAFFSIAQVPHLITNKNEGTKNKVCKLQGASMYLTLIIKKKLKKNTLQELIFFTAYKCGFFSCI
jgi:hypothetical protein